MIQRQKQRKKKNSKKKKKFLGKEIRQKENVK